MCEDMRLFSCSLTYIYIYTYAVHGYGYIYRSERIYSYCVCSYFHTLFKDERAYNTQSPKNQKGNNENRNQKENPHQQRILLDQKSSVHRKLMRIYLYTYIMCCYIYVDLMCTYIYLFIYGSYMIIVNGVVVP